MVSFSLKLVLYVCWSGFVNAALYQIRLAQVMFHDTSWAPKVSLRSLCSKDMGLEILTSEIQITPRKTHMCVYINIYIMLYIYIDKVINICTNICIIGWTNPIREKQRMPMYTTRGWKLQTWATVPHCSRFGGGIPNGSAPNSNGPRPIFRSLPIAWKNTQESELKT
jgi:hypothetical protein